MASKQWYRSIFNKFDPDIKITAAVGKTFIPDTAQLKLLAKVEGFHAIL